MAGGQAAGVGVHAQGFAECCRRCFRCKRCSQRPKGTMHVRDLGRPAQPAAVKGNERERARASCSCKVRESGFLRELRR